MKLKCRICDTFFETDKNNYVCPGCGENLDQPCAIDLDVVLPQIQVLREEIENRFWIATQHTPKWGMYFHGDFSIDSIEFQDPSDESVAVVTASSDCGQYCCGVIEETIGIKREWMKMSLSEMVEAIDEANQLERLEFVARQKKAEEDAKNAKFQADIQELRRLLALYPMEGWGNTSEKA